MLGSVKFMIGHVMLVVGIVGFIKVMLVVYNKIFLLFLYCDELYFKMEDT